MDFASYTPSDVVSAWSCLREGIAADGIASDRIGPVTVRDLMRPSTRRARIGVWDANHKFFIPLPLTGSGS